MPSTALNYFSNLKLEPVMRPDLAATVAVKLLASQTYVRGMILGEATPGSGTYQKYDNSVVALPAVILAYSCITDASGNPTGVTFPYPAYPDTQVEAYTAGYFDIATINTAMGDAGTLLLAAMSESTANWGRIVNGSITAGVFAF